jgi:hypothetical protein
MTLARVTWHILTFEWICRCVVSNIRAQLDSSIHDDTSKPTGNLKLPCEIFKLAGEYHLIVFNT